MGIIPKQNNVLYFIIHTMYIDLRNELKLNHDIVELAKKTNCQVTHVSGTTNTIGYSIIVDKI